MPWESHTPTAGTFNTEPVGLLPASGAGPPVGLAVAAAPEHAQGQQGSVHSDGSGVIERTGIT